MNADLGVAAADAAAGPGFCQPAAAGTAGPDRCACPTRCAPPISTRRRRGELPRHYCARIARRQGAGRRRRSPDDIVLCRRHHRRPRPPYPGQAGEPSRGRRRSCGCCPGRRHRVVTAVAVRRDDRIWVRDVVDSRVRMKRLSRRPNDGLSRQRRLAGQGRAATASRGRPAPSSRGSRAPTPPSSACRWPRLPALLQLPVYPLYRGRAMKGATVVLGRHAGPRGGGAAA